ncbi:MAG: LysR family transcriptional regulator [Pseudomonadota bacterium]
MNVFIAVAEEEGFSPAAKRLHMSPPAVTRAIASLEAHLGIKLLNRTTRHVRTTEAGQRYLEDVRRVLADINAADEAAIGINAAPKGQLSVTAPVLFGKRFVLPGVVEYLRRYPETKVSAVFLDRVVNLLEEGFDVGVRIGELPDSTMHAIRVGEVRSVICAASNYLAAHGTPEAPEELRQHTLIAVAASSGQSTWHFEENGISRSIRVMPRLNVTTNDAAVSAAELGFGLTRLLSYQVASEVSEGKLNLVLSSFEPQPSPIHIVHREGRVQSAKVRAFVDLMVEHFRSDKTINYGASL